MAITSYITAADLQLELSSSGVTLRVDDDATATAQVIKDGSIECDGYALLKYSRAALAASDWYMLKVKHVAAYYLCTRRANPCPQSVAEKYEKAIKDLEGVRDGSIKIPDAAARKGGAPVLSNQRVADHPVPRVVTEPGRSTGTPEGYTRPQPAVDPYEVVGDDWYI